MNKFFTKIATLVLGMTMAVGVGVAVGAKSTANPVYADSKTFSPSDFDGQGSSSGGSISATKGVITVSSKKGYGYSTGQFRILVGGDLTITCSSGTITALSLTFTSNSYTGGFSTSYSGLSDSTWTKNASGSVARISSLSVTYTSSEVIDTGTTTYVFYSKSWGAKVGTDTKDWTSGDDGLSYATNQGIQVTTTTTGANGTSPATFKNVSSIVIRYCTNASKGAGTIKVKVGSNTEKSFTVVKPESGGTTLKNASFSYSTTEDGKIKITVDCTSNSIYIYDIAITCGTLPVVESVETSGQKESFTTNETFSYGGTLTATYDTGDEVEVTPTAFKYGNSGIDPTTSGTAIEVGDAMTTSLNGKYIYVLYEENDVTVYTSYQITVTEPIPVKGTLTITTSGPFVVNDSGTLAYTLTGGSQSTLTTKTWAVDKSDILSVDESTGAYTALKRGTAKVTLTGKDADNFEYEVTKDFTVNKFITVTDILTLGTTGLDVGAGYTAWNGQQAASNAVYSGKTAGGDGAIQMNNTAGNYIWTTASGGVCTKIEFVRLAGKTSRTVTIYGSHTAITEGSTSGLTTIGTIGANETSLTPASDKLYEYILINSSGASYYTSFTISWKTNGPENPIIANPSLDAGQNKIVVGKTLKLYVTTNPTESDEKLVVSSSDNTKIVVIGSKSPYTLKGLAITTSPVTITVSGTDKETPFSSSVQVTVEEAQQTYDDKVLRVGTIDGLTGTGSETPAEYGNDGETYIGLRVRSNTNTVQFTKDHNGYFYNSTAYKADIKSVTVICDSINEGSFQIMGGSSANPSDVKTPVATLDVDGVNVYQFGSGEKFFKIYKNQTSNPIYISSIIVELVVTQSDPNTGNHYVARQAAQALLTGLNGKCAVEGNTITSAEWEALENNAAIAAIKTNATAKGILSNVERIRIDDMAITGAIMECAMYRYEYIVGTMGYKDIMGIGIQSNLAIPKTGILFDGENSNMVAIVVIVSLVSLTAIGGYFFLKKRREQN